jgi:5'-deoxynucleotidase YfbR-like HD superfamily hydrolase
MSSLVIDFFEKEHWDSLNVTVRWNGVRRIQQESLREHMYTSMLIADVLLEEIFPEGEEEKWYLSVLKLKILRSAAKHDVDEIFSGDILHSVKYNVFNGEELKRLLNDFVNYELGNNFNKQNQSHKMIIDSLNYYGNEVVKNFVKLVDWISCIMYIYNEKSLGNKNFDKYLPKCKSKLFESIDELKISIAFYHKKDADLNVLEELKQYFNKKITI